MLHVFECKQCGKPIYCFCFEYANYTEKGLETRKRQLDAMLCETCFGEIPELKQVEDQVLIPVTVIGREGVSILAARTPAEFGAGNEPETSGK